MDYLTTLWANPLLRQAISLALTLGAVGVFVRVLRRLAGRHVRDADARYRARKAVGAGGYVVAGLVLVAALSGRMGGLSVAPGAGSAGVAFALQEVIASFAGWVALSFGGFYAIGDRIQLGGIMGDVIDIGMLRTTLMECGGWVKGDLYNGRIVRVANSYVFKEPVFNYSGDFPFLWDELTVPIRYGSDYELARSLLCEIVTEQTAASVHDAKETWATMVRKFRIEDAKLEPMVTVVANDNWVEYTVRYVVPYRARRLAKDALFRSILSGVSATAGKVSFASATFELVAAPKLEMRLDHVPP
ncbi:MAG: mechanosensitive ion channel [Polyangiaceae bacterium]|nr:mechanosensitive ion channel [Polyangiaceae bacterium]